jgi:predicted acylesterase/phospholipase RssA
VIARREFLHLLGASALAPAVLGAASTEEVAPLERALVLSGGGARGAYEAGVVGALAAMGRISDGSPLAPYEAVCGASIGTLNGWYVATGQYTKLRELWYTISAQNLIRVKPEYAALRDPESGVLNRAASAFRLIGLIRNDRAILQNEPVYDWISRNMDPTTPLLAPLIFAVTNLTLQRSEYFYVRPLSQPRDIPTRVAHALQLTLGPHTIVREATPDIFHKALFASAAIPLAFDPVEIPSPDGAVNEYCDGGVAANSPVGVAHAISRGADVVLLDPPLEPDTTYADAVEVAFGAFGTMQRKILETDMRNAFIQSMGSRAFADLTPQEALKVARSNPTLAKLMQAVPDMKLQYIRPKEVLPLEVAGFDDQTGIGNAYRIGWEDATRGFTPYDWTTFQV